LTRTEDLLGDRSLEHVTHRALAMRADDQQIGTVLVDCLANQPGRATRSDRDFR
jgi:hypothetical protein